MRSLLNLTLPFLLAGLAAGVRRQFGRLWLWLFLVVLCTVVVGVWRPAPWWNEESLFLSEVAEMLGIVLASLVVGMLLHDFGGRRYPILLQVAILGIVALLVQYFNVATDETAFTVTITSQTPPVTFHSASHHSPWRKLPGYALYVGVLVWGFARIGRALLSRVGHRPGSTSDASLP